MQFFFLMENFHGPVESSESVIVHSPEIKRKITTTQRLPSKNVMNGQKFCMYAYKIPIDFDMNICKIS